MKNIALPIAEIQAKQLRAEERQRLLDTPVISSESKASQWEEARGKFDSDYADALTSRRQINALEISSVEKEELLLELDISADEKRQKGQALLDQIDALLTIDERDQRLQELQKQDDIFSSTYGPQKLSQDETAQRHADEIAYNDYVKNRKYSSDRQREYPSVGDQLDALWDILKTSDHPRAKEMIASISEVKTKYPKPGNKNA